jgi:hypothetical protein
MNLDEFDRLAWPTPRQPSAEVSACIQNLCTTELAPQKPITLQRRLLRSIGLSFALFALLLVVGWIRHPPKQAVLGSLLGAGAWGLLQSAVLFTCYGKPPGQRCSSTVRWVVGGTVLLLFVVHVALSATSQLTFSSFLTAPHSVRGTLACGFHALLFGAVASAALFVLWRRTDPFRPRLTGALTGLAGGLVGATALDLTCTSHEAWHLWLAHGATLVLVVALGFIAGRRWLSP